MPATIANTSHDVIQGIISPFQNVKIVPDYYDILTGKTIPSHFINGHELNTGLCWSITTSQTDKLFIGLEKSLVSQINKSHSYLTLMGRQDILKINRAFVSSILNINPIGLSLSLTADESIFYTFQVKNKNVYLQHYYNLPEGEQDETMFSVFETKHNVFNYSGTKNSALNILFEYFNEKKYNQQNLIHGLSC